MELFHNDMLPALHLLCAIVVRKHCANQYIVLMFAEWAVDDDPNNYACIPIDTVQININKKKQRKKNISHMKIYTKKMKTNGGKR